MDPMILVKVFAIVGAFNALVWTGILMLMKSRTAAMRQEPGLVLGPERAQYQGWSKYGTARTMGGLALTREALIFRRVAGKDIRIPIGEIVSATGTATAGPLRHTSSNYIALTLRDGSQPVFFVRENRSWLDALERLSTRSESDRAG
jgi:hypothetical protein